MNTIKKIEEQIKKNKFLLYMKGSPDYPSCTFSMRAVQIINLCKVRFAYIDVLKHKDIRINLPKYSNWPTFPQFWVNCQFIGGYDIMKSLYFEGKLQKMLNDVIKKN
ncbi:Grx4 family monothiol glutaredoxin [Candidatus Riesia pediculicola]|uniref:Glutaredoxin n=1 Tax=Riesia pediculicola (strain USDA) TaxID=515618 RepID=D4G7T9_RIEPU|nr:Grx4 family monothiol glutaredoxin [Candidatus Riesia pediculicola]ADD79883.1 putative glutaredoxin homolog [Candidatus Riesia pediculicola USDA]ARC53657.1 glutaredoxin [Candidatus Riesia pediculicola]QOJ86305.1 Grx4 family monothiol glutaredoxin [Candidatus Riesia pediculicola]